AANILKSPTNVPYQNVMVSNTGSSDPTVFSNYGPFQYQSANGTSNGVIIVAQGEGVINRSLLLIENGCSLLPVSFKLFTAVRNKNNVAIKWTTATEQNNKGFYVQRNTKGTWENIALIFSVAEGGNSSSDLSYSFNDLNNEKGVSQYRILQFDFDGRAKASEIRSVRGEAMASNLLVYPNPSMDGKVSVVFEDGASARNVLVSDMSGRMIKQYRNVSTNNLSIEGLENGVYSIQVKDLSSAAVSVEKIVIKRR
ncbi:MAG: T9SS type A sorting domain-containing protein, partial [Chitinophagaceae bacterium]